jgi:hypothetical protein
VAVTFHAFVILAIDGGGRFVFFSFCFLPTGASESVGCPCYNCRWVETLVAERAEERRGDVAGRSIVIVVHSSFPFSPSVIHNTRTSNHSSYLLMNQIYPPAQVKSTPSVHAFHRSIQLIRLSKSPSNLFTQSVNPSIFPIFPFI